MSRVATCVSAVNLVVERPNLLPNRTVARAWLTCPRGSLLLDELDEGAERGLGVDEGDGGPAAAGPGRLVDDLVALGLDPVERGRAVVDPVADVVDALAPASRGTSPPASRHGSA